MTKLRLAFMGTPDFAVPSLQGLIRAGHDVAAVYCQPPRPAGRGHRPVPSPVQRVAQAHGIAVRTPARLDAEAVAVAALALDVAVVVAYGLILPRAVLAAPRLGCLNVHASLLPRWRGAAPIQRAILAGDRESGVTIMQMDAGLDTGPVLAQRRIELSEHSDARQLQASLSELGAALLLETLAGIEAGQARAVAQPERGVSHAAKIDKLEARIDWRCSAEHISRQVRAFNTWPVAETRWHGQQLRIWQAHAAAPAALTTAPAAPGQVLGLFGEALQVACAPGVLAITKLQLAGRRALPAAEFVSGWPLNGARFD
jgi:methionyl-tRNA formyltransferase